MILRTEGLALGGHAVARADDGRVVFVRDAAPRELVRVEVRRRRPRFIRARALEVLEPGPDRVEPRCPHFSTCGGCTLQHVRGDAQAEHLARAGLEAIRRIGRIELDDELVEPSWVGSPYAHRARARWRVEGGRVGYFAGSSRRLVPVEVCPILVPALERALVETAAELDGSERGELSVVAADARVFGWSGSVAREAFGSALSWLPPGRGIEVRDAAGLAVVGPATFAQANPVGNDALLETLARWLPPSDSTLELYSGSGNFTRVLERGARRVVAAEIDSNAAKLAEQVRGPSTTLWTADAGDAVARAIDSKLAPELVVVNPPRTGISGEVARGIGELRPEVVIYVSCDPGTLGRDLGRLASFGLEVDRLRFFDLYPQTPHLEVMTRLSRRAPAAT